MVVIIPSSALTLTLCDNYKACTMQPCFEVVDVQKRENVPRPPKEEISPIPPIACVWMDDMAYAALEMDLTLGGISSCICFVEGFKISNKTLL